MNANRLQELEYFQPRAVEEERGAARVVPAPVAEWARRVEYYITRYPGVSLGVGFCVGVVLAWWIKRR